MATNMNKVKFTKNTLIVFVVLVTVSYYPKIQGKLSVLTHYKLIRIKLCIN